MLLGYAAHRCNLVWIFSTRHSASSRSGHGASVFTNDLLIFQSLRRELAGSLRHVAGFPTSDYYGPSAPPPDHQQTTCLAAAGLAGWRGGDPGAVPTFTTDRLTGWVPSFSPAGLSTATPQHFTVAPGTTTAPRPFPPVVRRSSALPPRPTIHQVRAGLLLEGVPPLVSALVQLSVSLAGPGPSGGAGPSRRCQGCSRPSPRLRGQAAFSFSGLLRQATGGSLHPTRSRGASWRTHP
jgi:hypothetical protein